MSWTATVAGETPPEIMNQPSPAGWQEAEKFVFDLLVEALKEHGLVSAQFAGQQYSEQYPPPVPPALMPLTDDEERQLGELLARKNATTGETS